MSHLLRFHELYSPWNSPGQNTGVGSLSLLQGIFPTQGLNPEARTQKIEFAIWRWGWWWWLQWCLSTFYDNTLCKRGFPDSSVGKESACNVGDPGSIPGSGRSAGEGIGHPLQYSWASLAAQLVKNPPAMWRPRFDLWVGKIPWRKERLPTPVFWPGELHGLYSPWGRKESDTTEWVSLSLCKTPYIMGKDIMEGETMID